jgi:hypothetical protein
MMMPKRRLGVALVPVLCCWPLFAWLDVFKLMTPWERSACCCSARSRADRLSGQRPDARHAADRLFSNYSRFVAPWIEEALKGLAMASSALPVQPHRLQARRGHLRLRHRRRLLGRREHLLPRPASRADANVWMVRGLARR